MPRSRARRRASCTSSARPCDGPPGRRRHGHRGRPAHRRGARRDRGGRRGALSDPGRDLGARGRAAEPALTLAGALLRRGRAPARGLRTHGRGDPRARSRRSSVCAAFYGHPGVFVAAFARGGEAGAPGGLRGDDAARDLRRGLPVRRPRRRSRPRPAARATRRPGSSSGVPRSSRGRRSSSGRSASSAARTTRPKPDAPRLPELVDRLRELYPDEHEVVVYEASSFVGIAPLIRPTPLAELAAAVTPASTLYVPPVERPDALGGDDVSLRLDRARARLRPRPWPPPRGLQP